MKKPSMIIFDYGETLLSEPGANFLRADEAIFKYIKNNKQGLTPKQLFDSTQELFEKISVVRELGFELHEWQFLKFVFEYLEIEFSISISELEKIYWNTASPGAIMPNADKMLEYINSRGIRSGVISNIMWSGAALTERISRFFPQNKFEFIIASSEYIFRKPSPMLFELALKKAELDASEVWFCGDNAKADVGGAAAVGIFPVWYEYEWGKNNGITPACEHLHIHDWPELIAQLEGLM